MQIPLRLQELMIALAVLVSTGVVLRKQCPGLLRRLRLGLALLLLRIGGPPWLRRLAGWLAPPAASHDRHCGGCNGCG